MKTISINRYAFSELSPEAQAKAIEKIRESEYENFPQYLLSEIMDQEASNLLFDHFNGLDSNLKLYYDLSHSQGSGVALAGEIFAKDKPNLTLPEACYRIVITHSGRYYHEYSFSVELFDENYEEIEGAERVLEELRDTCKRLEKIGYKWERDYFSDDNLKEIAINAGEVFTSSGNWSEPEAN